MSYYVQVQDGQVIGVPQPMSDNSSVSPNSHWGIDQLTSCGYVIVNPIPPVNYTVDLTTPTINSDGSVTYTFTPMTQQQLLDQAIQNFSWSTLMGTLFTTFGVVRAEQLGADGSHEAIEALTLASTSSNEASSSSICRSRRLPHWVVPSRCCCR